MNRRQFFRTAGASLGAAAAAARATENPGGLKAGFCERDITPDIGMEQAGGYVKSFLIGFHDSCKVRAAVFENAGAKAAVVSVDALVAPRTLVAAARKRIREQCGSAPESVLIAATHSHTSGPVAMVLPGEYDHADAFVRRLAYEFSSCAGARYLFRVETEIVAAVCH